MLYLTHPLSTEEADRLHVRSKQAFVERSSRSTVCYSKPLPYQAQPFPTQASTVVVDQLFATV